MGGVLTEPGRTSRFRHDIRDVIVQEACRTRWEEEREGACGRDTQIRAGVGGDPNHRADRHLGRTRERCSDRVCAPLANCGSSGRGERARGRGGTAGADVGGAAEWEARGAASPPATAATSPSVIDRRTPVRCGISSHRHRRAPLRQRLANVRLRAHTRRIGNKSYKKKRKKEKGKRRKSTPDGCASVYLTRL